MRIVATFADRKTLRSFERMAGNLADGKWKREAHRGVIDAGRKTKTKVQKAVFKQAGFRPGTYSSNVVAHTRLGTDEPTLSARIFAVRGGVDIDEYRGLRVVKPKGGKVEAGSVKSGVWNAPRVFKRSFSAESSTGYFGRGGTGFFALLPGKARSSAPPEFWTFGTKQEQKRDSRGRFVAGEARYGRKRRLYGASLRDEIGKGETLATFEKVAPAELEIKVTKRMAKLIRF